MKLHGKATITLKDAKNGLILHQESHENTITPALARIFASNLAGTMDYSKVTPLYSKLLGGVCLFNGTLDSTDVFLPKASDATLTAHAGQTTYSSADTDPKRGIPNTTLSSQLANGYMWVWEWGQTQGNGIISHIALTHSDTGDIWNESDTQTMDEDFSPVEDCCNHTVSVEDFLYDEENAILTEMGRIPIGFYEDVDHVVTLSIDTENETLTVTRSKFTGSGVWMWNDLAEKFDAEATYDFPLTYWQWGDFESLGIGSFYFAYDQENSKLYTFQIGTTSTGTIGSGIFRPYGKTIYIKSLDLTNGNIITSSINMTGTLGEGADSYLYGVVEDCLPIQLQVIDGCVYFPIFDATVYPTAFTTQSMKFNLSTFAGALVDGFYDDLGNNVRYGTSQVDLGNGRMTNSQCLLYEDQSGTVEGQAVYRDATVYGTGRRTARTYSCVQPTDSPIQYLTYAGFQADTNGLMRGCLLNKLYQATVFALESSVTKTSAMTMTVNYSIYQTEG